MVRTVVTPCFFFKMCETSSRDEIKKVMRRGLRISLLGHEPFPVMSRISAYALLNMDARDSFQHDSTLSLEQGQVLLKFEGIDINW